MRGSSKIRIVAVGAAVGAALACGIAVRGTDAATVSANLSVTVSVTVNCTVTTSPLAFGSYDPVVANASAALHGTGTVSVACTKGAAPTVGLDLGSNASGTTRRLSDGAGHFLNYEIYSEGSWTTVWGNSGAALVSPGAAPSKVARNLTAYGQMLGNQDVPAGSYSDLVTATVNF
jgi:spore coat protein U-like protein